MHLKKFQILITNKSPSQSSSLQWRTQIKQNQITQQVSSAILQRRNWVPILQKLNLSLYLTQHTFLQIIHKTQKNPESLLSFLNWVSKNLSFKPDFNSHCRVLSVLVQNGFVQSASTLMDSVIQSESVFSVVDLMINLCRDRVSQSVVSNFVIGFCLDKGLVLEGLRILGKIRVYGVDLYSLDCCDGLLEGLLKMGEVELGWYLCAAIVRSNVSMSLDSWGLVVQLLCKRGKLDNAVKLVNSGVYSGLIYDLIIDSYCKKGDLKVALDLLNDMDCKNLSPGFSTYSSVLDGACRYTDVLVIETIMRDMVAKKLLPVSPLFGYDSVIQKLCELGKVYAAKMVFERARNLKIGIRDDSYDCMLKLLCREGRGREAMEVFNMISEERITVKSDCYPAFAEIICKEEPSNEVEAMLKDLIDRGFIPCSSDLSKFIAAQCKQGRWKEVEGMLNLVLEKGLLLDCLCCSLLVEHYCTCKQVDRGIALHDKVEKLGGNLDGTTYNTLLVGLFKERKIKEASRVFDYMRRKKVLNTCSYSIMVAGLSHEKELRRAVQIHDEMLRVGLKPDKAIYKRLISRFL
ncbi:hypothetical protein Sjap_025292 [Stephania japonica]|uniref:Pentatricopeptide repeat-containing protein n=1 Tax=Stephania japonica TaxID=461633 RepID=A0AAP0E1K1_9MAGN